MRGADELWQHQLRSGGVAWEDSPAPIADLLCCPYVAHFGNARGEYQSAREGSVLFDLSDRAQIELRGTDARSFLHGLCTNDTRHLAPGEGCEAFVTNPKGRILAHVFAFATRDAVWINSPPIDPQMLLDHFDRYLFREQVQLHDRSHEFGELYISGPDCAARLTSLGLSVAALTLLQHAMGLVEGVPVIVRRFDFWDQPGFFLSTDRRRLVALWQLLAAAGLRPAGAQAFHALRIQAGFPLHGIDLSAADLAQEAGRTAQAISFTKGCYVGQESIARIDALGHINRQIRRLRVETASRIPSGAPLLASDGTPAGTLTSSMTVPGENYSVALAMLRLGHAQSGGPFTVCCARATYSATVP